MWRYLWIAGAIVTADQITKLAALKYLMRAGEVAVLPFLNLTLVFNTGAAFGFLSDAGGWQNTFFIVVAGVATAVILFMLRRLGPRDSMVATGLMLVLGGAIGNVIDRLMYGYVVDFIDVYYQSWHWPAFNVADAAITIGACLLLLDAFGVGAQRRPAP